MLSPEQFSVALLVAQTAQLLHSDKYNEAGQKVADWLASQTNQERPNTIDTRDKATEVLSLLLHWLLENNGYEEASQLLWGETLFSAKPESAQRVWKAFEDSNFILLMGAASMSKSYSMGVRLMLEWIRDPEYTTVKVLGPSEQHLEDNLFTHLVTLHRQSSIPLPGEIGKLFIGLDPRSRKGSITGVVIPLGKKAAGRIQGSKRVNRKTPHPVFGQLSRMFIFLDEIANIPIGVWKDIDNVIASSDGSSGLKIIGAFNPTNQYDEVGLRVEPPQGWDKFDPDTDLDWTSTRGWRVVRLDAARCENVLQNKIIFPGLQSKEGFDALIRNSGGLDSPGYWAMGRGCFPPTGIPMSIIPAGLLTKIRAEVIWYERPEACGGVDLALLGGDKAIFTKGSFGQATGIKLMPTLEKPEGELIMFKDHRGRPTLKTLLYVEAQLALPKGDTPTMKTEIVRVCRSFGIKPEFLCVDRTGNGQGVFDLLRHEWGPVHGINYTESASETRIMVEDQGTAYDLYERAYTELLFALRKFIEFGYVLLAPGIDTTLLYPQLTNRLYRMSGKRSRAEKKEEYQSRHNMKSPDEADSLSLIVMAVRKATGFVPGMMLSNSTQGFPGDQDEGDDARVDVTNRFEDID